MAALGETAATKTRRRRPSTTTAVKPPAGSAKAGRNPSKTGAKKTKPAKRSPRGTDPVEKILNLVRASRRGIDVPALHQRTGIDPVKIRNTIFAALRKGLIQRVSRGFYKGI